MTPYFLPLSAATRVSISLTCLPMRRPWWPLRSTSTTAWISSSPWVARA